MGKIKDEIINKIIEKEGGYVNDPSDSGGETKYGITKKTARKYGYLGSIKSMRHSEAERIYSEIYWNAVNADMIVDLSEAVALEVVDTGVNMGVSRAAKIFQRALNSLNDLGRVYADIAVDGAIGPNTIAAFRKYLSRRDEDVLLKAMNCLQGVFYIELAERRKKDERFLYGWLKNRVAL